MKRRTNIDSNQFMTNQFVNFGISFQLISKKELDNMTPESLVVLHCSVGHGIFDTSTYILRD